MTITFWRAFGLLAIVIVALAFSVPLSRPTTVGAATLTVDTLVDDTDGSCSDGDCSLRDAILLANSNAGTDTIGFSVAGTINVATDLPALSDGATVIDGTTAPGYAGTPLVIVDGSGISSSTTIGLIRFNSDNNVVSGLRLQNVFVAGVNIQEGDSNLILDSELIGNEYGVTIFGESDENVLLGNLISENEYGGIFMDCDGSQVMQDNQILGNQITDNHTQGFTQGAGIDISPVAGTALVSGTNISGGNIISGNDGPAIVLHPRLQGASVTGTEINGNTITGNGSGIRLSTTGAPTGAVSDTSIVGNTITDSGGIVVEGDQDGDLTGLNVSGNTVSDPDSSGIVISVRDSADASGYEITGNSFTQMGYYGVELSRYSEDASTMGTVSGNTITDNGAAGVYVYRAQAIIGPDNLITGNASSAFTTGVSVVGDDAVAVITRNSIHHNIGLGIDLGDDGVTPNDPGDTDTGPNGLLNFPVISSATMSTVEGTACASCTVEVFAAVDDGDNDGHGEGKTFLGYAEADESGDFSVSIEGAPDCGWVTATATQACGPTSEFAANVRLPCAPHPRTTATATPEPTNTPVPPSPSLPSPSPAPIATPIGAAGPMVVPPATGEGTAAGGLALPLIALLLAGMAGVAVTGGLALRARGSRS